MAWRRAGFVPEIPRTTTGRGTATQATKLATANRRRPVWPIGCRLRVHHREHRWRIGAARSRCAQFDVGSAEETSTDEIEESPVARFERCFVYLVSEARKSGLLRPLDARVFSRWSEISAHRSRRGE